jgi:hypothetical protein
MSDLHTNPKGGAFKTGIWVQRTTEHPNCEEFGFLTKGKSYQVMSPDKYYTQSPMFLNKCGNPIKDAETRLAKDMVVLRDDQGKISIFAARHFTVTSSGGK